MIRPCRYLNNIVEQDHRAVKRMTRPMLGFKSLVAAGCTIAGLEVIHANRKGQLAIIGSESHTPAEQFYALAAYGTATGKGSLRRHLQFSTEPIVFVGDVSQYPHSRTTQLW